MVDASLSDGGLEASICPWCSASYVGDPEHCPSCGAALAADPTADPSLPGLTAIDAAAIVRAKTPAQRPRNRLLSWISGEYPESEATPAEAAALAPPDVQVRREMLRLELEAEVANLQAEAEALRAEAVVEGRGSGVLVSTVEADGTVPSEDDGSPQAATTSSVAAQAPGPEVDAPAAVPPDESERRPA